jgi:hypothetical protein
MRKLPKIEEKPDMITKGMLRAARGVKAMEELDELELVMEMGGWHYSSRKHIGARHAEWLNTRDFGRLVLFWTGDPFVDKDEAPALTPEMVGRLVKFTKSGKLRVHVGIAETPVKYAVFSDSWTIDFNALKSSNDYQEIVKHCESCEKRLAEPSGSTAEDGGTQALTELIVDLIVEGKSLEELELAAKKWNQSNLFPLPESEMRAILNSKLSESGSEAES